MIGFSVDDILVRSKNGLNFVLQESFTFTRKNGEVITVPIGTTSDGASTPAILWEKFGLSWIPPFGWYWKAAFLHDYLYRCSNKDKAYCDDVLLESMQILIEQAKSLGFFTEQEHDLKAKIIYEGVTLGGWKSFEEDRKANVIDIQS